MGLPPPPPPTGLVGVDSGAAILENSLVVPQTVKHRGTTRPRNFTPRPTYICTKTYIQMLIAALFLRASKWEQPNAHQWMKK